MTKATRDGERFRMDVEQVFCLVYGRPPTDVELDRLGSLVSLSGIRADNATTTDPISLFRLVLAGFDHQTIATPFSVRLRSGDIAFASLEGIEVAVDHVDPSTSQLIERGVYESHVVRFLQQHLHIGTVFVDVGANIGFYSMLAARRVGSGGRVLSFEPNSENCRLILLGADKNGFDNIQLFPLAAGRETGHVCFSTHFGSNGGVNTREPTVALLSPNTLVVPSIRLDDIVDTKIDVLKMDVEGAEGMVVQGATGLIEKHRPIITSEFSLEMLRRVSGVSGLEYLKFFTDRGYCTYLLERGTDEVTQITDVEDFVAGFGDLSRIEDLAFLPEERA
jgi:FkbM family methyltransferase